jgi:hypothetical protein
VENRGGWGGSEVGRDINKVGEVINPFLTTQVYIFAFLIVLNVDFTVFFKCKYAWLN